MREDDTNGVFRITEYISDIIIHMKVSIFFSVLIAAVALMFAFQNYEIVQVTFFKWGFEGPVALVIIASLLIGFIIGFILLVPSHMSSKWKIETQKDAIDQLQKRLEEETIKYDSEGLGAEGENRGRI